MAVKSGDVSFAKEQRANVRRNTTKISLQTRHRRFHVNRQHALEARRQIKEGFKCVAGIVWSSHVPPLFCSEKRAWNLKRLLALLRPLTPPRKKLEM